MPELFQTIFQTRYAVDARPVVAKLLRSLQPARYAQHHGTTAFRLDRPSTGSLRTTTEIVVDEAFLWIRVRFYGHDLPNEDDMPLDILQTILKQTLPIDGGLLTRPAARGVTDEPGVAWLIQALVDPTRWLPLVLMSEPVDQQLLAMAQRLHGMAHIVWIASRLSHRLVDAFGPQWPTHGGAIRTFASPFPGPRNAHPLVLAANRPSPDLFVRRVQHVAVAIARNYAFPSIDTMLALADGGRMHRQPTT